MSCWHYPRLPGWSALHGRRLRGRYRDQRDRPDLTNPESLQLYLETRFEQLKVRGAPLPRAAPAHARRRAAPATLGLTGRVQYSGHDMCV